MAGCEIERREVHTFNKWALLKGVSERSDKGGVNVYKQVG